jgi:LmbE family N-acetylglucosaminyl deacetylase
MVVAHPDDETLGAGSLLQGLSNFTIVHVTDGAPRDPALRSTPGIDTEAYAAARRTELAHALTVGGGRPPELHSFGVRDQEVVDHIPVVARALALVISTVRPDVLLTHPYEGGHPDHDAVACAVQAALALVHREGADVPHALEMAYYHAAGGEPTYGRFVPLSDRVEYAIMLASEVRARKNAMLACFASQSEVLSQFPRDVERYREAGSYDFGLPPHEGRLHYERMGWAVGASWRERVRRAAAALALESSLCRTPVGPS